MSSALLLAAALASARVLGAAAWSAGRATWYGDSSSMSIHSGNCGYGYLDPHAGTGWDIAAISDKMAGFDGSCGKCFEVRCRPASFTDGNGAELHREDACYDPTKSIVVTITDSCPCYKPGNEASNKRWCCGDMPHFDLSQWAFEKLASKGKGAIGIEYRPVDCGYRPGAQAGDPPGGASPGDGSTSASKKPSNCGGPDAKQCDGKSPGPLVQAFNGKAAEPVPQDWNNKQGKHRRLFIGL